MRDLWSVGCAGCQRNELVCGYFEGNPLNDFTMYSYIPFLLLLIVIVSFYTRTRYVRYVRTYL